MFTHDVIKMRYSEEGYLPDYPPHLISDEEMFDAFIPMGGDDEYFHLDTKEDEITFNVSDWTRYTNDTNPSYFKDNYPNVSPSNLLQYKMLIADIEYHIQMYLTQQNYSIPSWVYSYMLKETIGPGSPKEDIHDLLVMLLCDNIDDEFTEEAALKCIDISIRRINAAGINKADHRPITMFGEPFVMKYLRLRSLVR